MSNPTQVCVFNTTNNTVRPLPNQTGSNLIDIVTGVDGVLVPSSGPQSAGVPVVLNPSGLLDPSLTKSGSLATTDTSGVSTGQLVTLYIPTSGPYVGQVVMQPATAANPPLSPAPPFPQPPNNWPTPAMGFVASSYAQGIVGTVYFAGTFVYNDPIHEFSADSIGKQVYLANSNDGTHGFGAVTLTPPTPPNEIQAVGLVTNYNLGLVTVAFVPSFPAGVTNVVNFSNILTGTNTGATMTVGSGASINYTGSGIVNASSIAGVTVTGTPTAGQSIVATSGTAASWQSVSATPGGSTGEIQYNNSGAFGGAANSKISNTGAVVLGNAVNSSPTASTALTVSASGGITTSAQDWYSSNEGTTVAQLFTSGYFVLNGININSNVSIGAHPALSVTGGNAGSPDIADFITGIGGTPASTKVVWIDVNGNLHILEGLFDSTGSLGTSGQILSTTGSVTQWINAPSATPGGTNREIQFNNSGTFGGTSVTTDSSFQALWINPTTSLGSFLTSPALVASLIVYGDTASNYIAYLQDHTGTAYATVDPHGCWYMQPNPSTATAPLLQLNGDNVHDGFRVTSGGNGNAQFFAVQPFGTVSVAPNLSVSVVAPALTVNSDQQAVNNIANFYDGLNNYNVVAISQPLNTGNTAAVTITGDSSGSNDIVDFFVNVNNGSGFTAGTGVTMDNNGDVTLINTTPATGSNNFPSPKLNFDATYWTGSASVSDGWSVLDDTTNMSGPRLTFTYTGSQTNYGIQFPQGTSTQPSIFFGGLGQGISGLAPGPQDAVCIFGGQLVVNETGGGAQVYLSAGATSVLGTSVNGGSPGTQLEITTNGFAPTIGGYGVSIGGTSPANTTGTFSAVELGTTATNPITWAPTSGSGTFNTFHVQAQVNQTGSASGSYTGIALNVVETAVLGTGNLLLSLNAGTLGTTSKFYVDNSGDTVMVGYVMSSGVVTAITTKTGTYTATDTDHTINGNGTFTINLPTTGIQIGQEYYIKNIGSGVITVASTVNIDFAASLTLSTPGASVTVQWDGTQYWIY